MHEKSKKLVQVLGGILTGWLLFREAFDDWYIGAFFEKIGLSFNTSEIIQYVIPVVVAISLSIVLWRRARLYVLSLILAFGLNYFLFWLEHHFANS